MNETIVLDPIEFAPNRVELALDELGLRISQEGADWGETNVAVQLAKTQNGSVVTDRRMEPVEMTIPLQVREDSDVSLAEAAQRLQQKLGIFQANERELNWIRRDFDDGAGMAGSVGYIIYNAGLHGLQGWLMAHRRHAPEVTLTLLRSPYCYSTEEVESETFTEDEARALQFELADVLGTAPGLIRFRVDNEDEEDDWRGLLVSYESRDLATDGTADTTAALVYEAEDLTPAGGAAEAERTGASGGKVVRHSSLTAGWLTILESEIDGIGHMTHLGTRRLWTRIYVPGSLGDVELQAQFRPLGALTWSPTNLIIPTPVAEDFALIDLGECRPEPAILGEQRWQFRIQARAADGAGEIDLDQVYPLPTEGLVLASAPGTSAGADAQSTKSPGAAANDETSGTVAWETPGNAKASDGSYAVAKLKAGEISNYEKLTDFGFELPEDATVTGFIAAVERSCTTLIYDADVRLVHSGVIGGGSMTHPGEWPTSDAVAIYGAADSLWSDSWDAPDVNSSEFGIAIAARCGIGAITGEAKIDSVSITVYYTEAADENRICFAERSVEVRSDGVYRQLPDDDVWGPVVAEGFNPDAPPSWLEERALRGLVLPSQGDFDTLADAGSNPIGLTVIYRPAYHFAREAAA
jgi:hypothetical protein